MNRYTLPLHQWFFILLLLSLPVQLGYHFWPEWAYVFGRRIDIISPTLYATDILVFLVCTSYVFSFHSKRKPFHVSGRTLILFCSVCVFAILNIYNAKQPILALYIWGKYTELFCLAWYIVQTKPGRLLLSIPLSIGILYVSVIALSQSALQRTVSDFFWILGERSFSVDSPGVAKIPLCFPFFSGCREWMRAYGTFPHPNVLGGFLAVSMLFLLSQRLARGIVVVCMLGIAAMVATFSRSAWTVFSIGVLLMHVRHTIRAFWVYIALVCIGLVVVYRPGISDASVQQRIQLAQSAFDMWRSSPVFGVGLGNFLAALPEYTHLRTIEFLQPVHSIVLLLLAEGGLVGLLLCSWGIFRLLRGSKQYIPFLMLLLIGLADHYPYTLQQGQLMIVVFGAYAFYAS